MLCKNLILLAMAAVGYVAPAVADLVKAPALYEYIQKKHNITIANTDTSLISMHYVMQVVDKANEKLNGFKLIDYTTGLYVLYANDPVYARSHIASSDVVRDAVDVLIKKVDFPLWVVPEGGSVFSMNIAAGGTFYIDWGDGVVNKWSKNVGPEEISHTYTDGDASEYKVYIGGEVTRYPTTDNGAIWFGYEGKKVREVGGCMGCVFHTLDDGINAWQQPKFHATFDANTMLQSVPAKFFDGLHGAGYRMFYRVFAGTGLTDIPATLFGDSQLTPASGMFLEFCSGCRSLENVPANLFLNVSGDAAGTTNVFASAFKDCSALKTIPVDLFGVIENIDSQSVFANMFYNDQAVTGPLAPKLNGKYVWEWWPDWQTKMLYFVPLDDWGQIPAGWR